MHIYNIQLPRPIFPLHGAARQIQTASLIFTNSPLFNLSNILQYYNVILRPKQLISPLKLSHSSRLLSQILIKNIAALLKAKPSNQCGNFIHLNCQSAIVCIVVVPVRFCCFFVVYQSNQDVVFGSSTPLGLCWNWNK